MQELKQTARSGFDYLVNLTRWLILSCAAGVFIGLVGVAIATLASLVVSKTYRIMVGMHFYNTGASEWKVVVLCALGVAAAVLTLFSTTLLSDVLVCTALLVAVAVIMNKDFVTLVRSMKDILRAGKKTEAKGEAPQISLHQYL